MPFPLAAPLAPAAATVAAGAAAYLMQGFSQFQGGPRTLPPVTGQEGTATLDQMIQDALAGARVPVGYVPPEPQGPDPEALLGQTAAAAAGAWDAWQRFRDTLGNLVEDAQSFWGALNSRPATGELLPEGLEAWPKGNWNPEGSNVWRWEVTNRMSHDWPNCREGIQQGDRVTEVITTNGATAWLGTITSYEGPCPGVKQYNPGLIYSSQTIGGSTSGGSVDSVSTGGLRSYSLSATVSTADGWVGVPFPPAPLGALPPGYVNPQIPAASKADNMPTAPALPTPQPAAMPSPVEPEPFNPWDAPIQPEDSPIDDLLPSGLFPIPQGGSVGGTTTTTITWSSPNQTTTQGGQTPTGPTVPGSVVTVGRGTTGTTQQVGPVPTSVTQPVPTTTTPTTEAGLLAQTQAITTAVTSAVSHFIEDFEATAETARADLMSIAQELQRVENKTARILRDMKDKGDEQVTLGDILGPLAKLLEQLMNQRNEGAYGITSPCEVDENGALLPPREAHYDGGYVIDNINSKIDAIAHLLQHHKDMKQPNCEEMPLPTLNATVQFTEVI